MDGKEIREKMDEKETHGESDENPSGELSSETAGPVGEPAPEIASPAGEPSATDRQPLLCPVCKAVLPDGSQFCQYCGSPLPQPEKEGKEDVPVSPKKKKAGTRVLIFLSAVAVCTALILLYIIPINRTVKAIGEIGAVSMDSKAAIENAEGQYNRLIGIQKKNVSNFGTLQDSRAAYDSLASEVSHADSLIASIGTVTDESQLLIREARDAYDALSDSQKSYAQNYSLLEQREAEYQDLRYKELMDFYNNGAYDSAQAAITSFLTDFSDSSHTGELQELLVDVDEKCAEELIDQANSYYTAKQYEQALAALDSCLEAYASSAAAADASSLRDEIAQTVANLRPKSGSVLYNNLGSGEGKLTVVFPEGDAGDKDYCIKVQSDSNESKYKTFYIRAGESATINVPDGTYVIKYAIGSTWYGTDAFFGTETVYACAGDTLDFSTSSDSRYVYYDTWTLTVGNVQDGNLQIALIGADEY